MRKLFIIALAVSVFCVLLAAPALAEDAKKDEAKKPAMPAGQKVFTEAKCQMCHTVYSAAIGEPPAKDAEKDESGPPDLSMTGKGKTAEWMSLFLQKKEALNDKKHMKKFKGSDEELTALVDWLLTLKPAEEKAPVTKKVEKAEKIGKVEKAAKAVEGEAAEKASDCGHDHGDHDKASHDDDDEHGDHDEHGDDDDDDDDDDDEKGE